MSSDLRARIVATLRAAHEKRGVQIEAYLGGPRNDRFERVEGHGLDDASEVAFAVAAEALRAVRERIPNQISQDVAEIPDRTSPDDAPEMMAVTSEELMGFIEDRLNQILQELAGGDERPQPSAPVAAEQGWQPIETAPKDGTVILVMAMLRGQAVIGNGFWYRAGYVGSDWVLCTMPNAHQVMERLERPTHWMPLPDPPEVGSGTQATEAEPADAPRRSDAP